MTKAPILALLWMAGTLLTAGSAPAAPCNPDPYDELRCTRGLDPQTCKCIGEEQLPRTSDPCRAPQSEAQHSQCLESRLRYLDNLCASSRTNVRNKQLAAQWKDVWRYANNHGWNKIQIPPNCQPG
jgi:hypothetical protein